ncbi:unnamed protein product, partial [Linum tenue]
NLVYLDLSHNQLKGEIPTHWQSFQKLEYIDLRYNSFNGSIPPSLFTVPSLQNIQLAFNQLKGQAPDFSNPASSVLDTFDLSSNNLEGPIPPSIFKVQTLKVLILSSNRFKGSVQWNCIQALPKITTFDLSYSNLTDIASGNNKNSTLSSIFPQFNTLSLAWSNLRIFPELGNQSRLSYLDLSGNNISGVVSRWILESTTIYHLNLSHNNLRCFEVPISLPYVITLDLQHNNLQGEIPIISSLDISYVDYSHNDFNGSITAELSNHFLFTNIIILSNNRIGGVIPTSICTASSLRVLDLSNQ